MHPSLIYLQDAYRDFSDLIRPIPEERFLASMNGWSPRDVVAHLIGWNRGMIEAARAILEGRTPDYYAGVSTDYREINAGYVAEYASRSKVGMLAELAASMAEFERYVQGLNPVELEASHGVMHYRGSPATVGGIIQSLARDYQDHARQIRAWLSGQVVV